MNTKSITRLATEKQLIPLLMPLKSKTVLDVGAKNSPYLKFLHYKKYLRLDISPASKPDIVCDLHKIKWTSSYFDLVIATEVLEHLYDPRKAIKEMYRVLKPRGILILSTRFIFRYHPDPQDYFRFTPDSLAFLLQDFKDVQIYSQGNKVQVLWQILASGPLETLLAPLNPLILKINYSDPLFPLGFVALAKKG